VIITVKLDTVDSERAKFFARLAVQAPEGADMLAAPTHGRTIFRGGAGGVLEPGQVAVGVRMDLYREDWERLGGPLVLAVEVPEQDGAT
jgi:hypothetical protein